LTSQLWIPGVAGPHDDFIQKLHRQIRECAPEPHVEVELSDGSRVVAESIAAEPGYGFVTLRPHPTGEPPEAVVVPLGSIRRIEISKMGDQDEPVGFTLPE
jgi:hypothetical protein